MACVNRIDKVAYQGADAVTWCSMQSMRVLLVLILVGELLGGCSFFMTKAPLTDPGTRPLDCEKSMVPPGADAVSAGALGLIGIVSIPLKDEDSSTATFVVAEVVLVGVAALLAYSAYTGYKSVKRCRAFNAVALPPARE